MTGLVGSTNGVRSVRVPKATTGEAPDRSPRAETGIGSPYVFIESRAAPGTKTVA